MTPPTDAALAGLCVESYRAQPAGEVYDAGPDRIVIDRHTDHAVMTIRGTCNVLGWWTDFAIAPRSMADHPDLGACEAGFLAAAEALYRLVKPAIGGAPIVLTGHSRGAAIVPILAAMMTLDKVQVARCVAFEAPWAVGSKLRHLLQDAAIDGTQYWNGNDPVPSVPALPWLVPWVWPIKRIGHPMMFDFECHSMALIAAELAARAA